jgi:hypothetical protein
MSVSGALFLLPFDAIDILAIGREYLFAQPACADDCVQVYEVHNLAYRVLHVCKLAVETLGGMIVKIVPLPTVVSSSMKGCLPEQENCCRLRSILDC